MPAPVWPELRANPELPGAGQSSESLPCLSLSSSMLSNLVSYRGMPFSSTCSKRSWCDSDSRPNPLHSATRMQTDRGQVSPRDDVACGTFSKSTRGRGRRRGEGVCVESSPGRGPPSRRSKLNIRSGLIQLPPPRTRTSFSSHGRYGDEHAEYEVT